MKTIGLVGGTSWESTLEYYRLINKGVNRELGGHASARIILQSLNFQELLDLSYDLPRKSKLLEMAAQNLEKAGAQCVLLCANTLHKHAGEVQARISIPLLNIIDGTAKAVKESSLSRVGLLGTQYTMEEEFYKGKLKDAYGIDVVVPGSDDSRAVHSIIFNELCRGIFSLESKDLMLKIIEDLKGRGALGIIMGCTEIPLLIGDEDTDLPFFNTLRIHADMAVNFALL